jgi:hypothetical protein
MAVPATAHWEVRTDGDNDNGGAFNFTRSGNDYPSTNTVFVYSGNLVQPGTDKNRLQVSPGRQFEANDIGNVINLTGGTGIIPGRYEITAVSGGIATLDSNCWSTNSGGSGGSGRLGGAIAHPSVAARATYQPGARSIFIWMRAGDYLWAPDQVINESVNISGMHFEGYETNRGDRRGFATWKATTGVYSILNSSNPFTAFNIIFDANNVSDVWGPLVFYATFYNCRFLNFLGGVSNGSLYDVVCCVRCMASGCTNYGFSEVKTVGCIASNCNTGFVGGVHSNSIAVNCEYGFYVESGQLDAINCVAYYCASSGFCSSVGNITLVNCTSYNSGGDGFEISGVLDGVTIVNCVAEGSRNYGFFFQRIYQGERTIVHRIRGFNNTSGLHNMTNSYVLSDTLRAVKSDDVINLTSSPFMNPADGDFRLKRTEPVYSECRAILQSPPNITADWEPRAFNVGPMRQFDLGGVIVIEED